MGGCIGRGRGVGLQLHIITALLFGTVSFLVSVYLLKKNWRVWKKIILVFAVVFVLNFPQLYSELHTGFSNSKIFAYSITHNGASGNDQSNLAQKIGLDLNCHMENNAYILSSFGSNSCLFSYGIAARKIFHYKYQQVKKTWSEISQPDVAISLIVGFIFSLAGYFFLAYRAWKEQDERKKIFLRLISLYIAVSFLLMLPLAEKFIEARYFIQVFFVPFLLLGFLADFLMRKFSQKAIPAIVILFAALAYFNLSSLASAAKDLRIETKSDVHFAILGEMELMVKYMINDADSQKEIYLVGDKPYRAHFFQPFFYLARKSGVNVISVGESSQPIAAGNVLFYLTDESRGKETTLGGYAVESRKVFGQVAIYKLRGI